MKRPWLYEGVTTVTSGRSASSERAVRIPVPEIAKRMPRVQREPEPKRKQHRRALEARGGEKLVVLVQEPAGVRIDPCVRRIAVMRAEDPEHFPVDLPAPRQRLVATVHARARHQVVDLRELAALREPDPEIVIHRKVE